MGILEIEIDGTTVLVESSDISESGAKVVAATKVKVQKKFGEILAVIKPICSSIIKTIEQMPKKPNTATAGKSCNRSPHRNPIRYMRV
jgi:hypothetical protein